jgi:hypothetical protein
MEVIQKASGLFSTPWRHHRKNDRFPIFKEIEMNLAVTFDLRISARSYGRALETPRRLAANGLLAL